ncbi:MAG: bifunctional phosphopantothenoylcysteine decarboxylase/phosphopantothenate--cysteine ligase CoaBC [Flavobacteriales bacterium]|nr:bifunctional phosphopantothenoylcysteine decarboxylase/phosphopantothenate--cysteine ligase CoaBC [Flavobacteriales bacterium]
MNRKVLLGVSGGIAAYKAAHLTRLLVKAGCEVQVVLTPSAHDFIPPLTLATLSKRPVLTDLFVRDGTGHWNDHVHLARWADVIIIAPATANTMAKMVQGLCDNLLLACALSAACPMFIAPAMDLEMWKDTGTQSNVDALRARGVRIVGPESGELASGLVGEGRMSEPETILAAVIDALIGRSKLNGMRLLVTAGPTQEAIDPVRYIGNRSSGKMGFALAEEAAARGAQIELVTGPVGLSSEQAGIIRTDVTNAAEMAVACKERFLACNAVIMSAAVADFRPAHAATEKVKKKEATLDLNLEPTEDILGWMGAHKPEGLRLVGFALETENAMVNAMDKLTRKNLDLLVLNSLRDAGAGFGTDTNKVTLLARGKDPVSLPLMSKRDAARAILDRLEEIL